MGRFPRWFWFRVLDLTIKTKQSDLIKVSKIWRCGLASKGIAVYRYTKRTEKYEDKSSDDPVKLTVDDEVISDARAAVALVSKQPKINPKTSFPARP